MSSSKLIRWSGSAALVSGVLGFVEATLLALYGDPPGPRAALYAYELSWGATAILLALYALALGRLHRRSGRDITNILSKLQVADRSQAIVRARDAGLV